MTEKNINMELWDKVSETNPKYTKEVNLGRKFNAIDPMYQVMEATRHFGSCGKGWGFEVMETLFLPINSVALRIRLWQKSKEHYVEQWGQCKLYADNKETKPDHDCMKKATTDGVTKCLSLLGFNADVFLGKFDDNKYVRDLENKFNAEAIQQQEEELLEQKRQKAKKWLEKFKLEANQSDPNNLDKLLEKCKDIIFRLETYPDILEEFNDFIQEQRSKR